MDTWQKIIKLGTVDSTNTYTWKKLKETQFPEGTIFSAMQQTAGRGNGSNQWESEKGKNILLSLILYPTYIAIENQFLISKAISLGIANYAQSKTDGIKIKWPNDIYYKDRKIAGILIENTIKGTKINASVVGIGFNINQETFKSNAPNPVSLKQITGKNYSPDQEIIKLRNNIRFFYDLLKAGKLDEINHNYLKCLYRFNEFAMYKSQNIKFKAKITGISDFGHLQLTTENGEQKQFDFKEVEFIL